jgi:hypothetical protein
MKAEQDHKTAIRAFDRLLPALKVLTGILCAVSGSSECGQQILSCRQPVLVYDV